MYPYANDEAQTPSGTRGSLEPFVRLFLFSFQRFFFVFPPIGHCVTFKFPQLFLCRLEEFDLDVPQLHDTARLMGDQEARHAGCAAGDLG